MTVLAGSSSALTSLILTLLLLPLSSAESKGPVSQCTYDGEYIADGASCTRYYKCRIDETGIFATDILICPDNTVYDMVTGLCNDTTKNYWQDPSSCTKFYGCHTTKETSEGYIRQHYVCTGNLRFHPNERYCTFKTKVPDFLCNSRADEQTIIGTDDIYLYRDAVANKRRVAPAHLINSLRGRSTSVSDQMDDDVNGQGFGTSRTAATVADVGRSSDPPMAHDSDNSVAAITQQLLKSGDLKYSMPGYVPGAVITHAQLQAREDRGGDGGNINDN